MLHSCDGTSWFWYNTLVWKNDLQQGKKISLFPTKYSYKHYKEAYKALEVECLEENRCAPHSKSKVECGRAREILEVKQRTLVIDDLYDAAANSKELLYLVIAGRHRNFHWMVLRHNLFKQSKY